jgi:hypothetical protein
MCGEAEGLEAGDPDCVMTSAFAAQFAGVWSALDTHGVDPSTLPPDFGETVVAVLTAEVRRAALCLYQYLIITQDWGEIGDYQIRQSFFENVSGWIGQLGDPEVYLQTEIARFPFADWDQNQLAAALSDWTLTVGDTSITIHQAEKINRLLRAIRSTHRLQAGYHGKVLEMIWGRTSEEKIGPYWAMTFTSEIARTPHVVGSMAAVIGNGEIFVRDEALRYVFDIKWQPYFDHRSTFVTPDLTHQASHRVKQAVALSYLEAYGVSEAKPYFLGDLAQTVLYHEVGHGIAQDHFLEAELSGFAEATRVFGENIYTVLHEFLADFVPDVPIQRLHSALTNILAIACQNPERAFRMYAMYVSDTWFFDTPDAYMYLYSDLTSFLLSVYLTGPATVDFDRLATDIGPDVAHPGPLLALVKTRFHAALASLQKRVAQSEICFEGRRVALADIRNSLLSECHAGVHQGSIWAQYWSKVLGELLYPDDAAVIQAQLHRDCQDIMNQILGYFEPGLTYDPDTLRHTVARRLLAVF